MVAQNNIGLKQSAVSYFQVSKLNSKNWKIMNLTKTKGNELKKTDRKISKNNI